jgi:hypothetical protein
LSHAVLTQGAAAVSNAGLISSNSASHSAIDMQNGGSIDNLAGGTIAGSLHGAIYILAAAATIANAAGGPLTGQGVISGYFGVDISGAPPTLRTCSTKPAA